MFVQRNRVEIEQVGFDGEGVGSKGRTVADVGDGVEGFAGFTCPNCQRCDVDTVCGKQFCVGSKVDRGDRVAGAVAAA